MIYRVLHDWEIGPLYRHDVPEVSHGTGLAKDPKTDKQFKDPIKITPKLRALIKGINSPYLTDKRLTGLLNQATAFTNTNPNVIDKPRLCGGAVVHGEEHDGVIWIEAIDATKPLPTAEWVWNHPEFMFRCWIVKEGNKVIDFPHCTGTDKVVHPVYWLVIANGGWIIVDPAKVVKDKPFIHLKRGAL